RSPSATAASKRGGAQPHPPSPSSKHRPERYSTWLAVRRLVANSSATGRLPSRGTVGRRAGSSTRQQVHGSSRARLSLNNVDSTSHTPEARNGRSHTPVTNPDMQDDLDSGRNQRPTGGRLPARP